MVLDVSCQWAEDGDADEMSTVHRAAPVLKFPVTFDPIVLGLRNSGLKEVESE